jgi:hypothetical protein
LSIIILVTLAEKFKPAVASVIDTPESHIDSVADPGVHAVQRID